MKKTIKIIDLLNKIANGEEVPKEIKYKNFVYGWVKNYKTYTRYDITGKNLYIITNNLNDYVEILDEEEFEDIEKFEEHKLINTRDILELEMLINKINADYNYKINQLIKNQKKIIERLNNVKDKR